MNNTGKYFYYRFSTDFFNDDRVSNIRHVPIYGYQMFYIYIKLCQLAIPNRGYIRVLHSENSKVKSYVTLLSKDIGEPVEVVEYAMEYFLRTKLVEEIKDIDHIILYVEKVINNTGASSKDADRKRLEYNKKYTLDSSDFISLEEPKELNQKEILGIFGNVYLTLEEYEYIKTRYDSYEEIINNYSTIKSMQNLNIENDLEEIIKRYEK